MKNLNEIKNDANKLRINNLERKMAESINNNNTRFKIEFADDYIISELDNAGYKYKISGEGRLKEAIVNLE